MSAFATEFPIRPDTSVGDFLASVRSWLINSPHTQLSGGEIEALGQGEISKAQVSGESAECWVFEDSTVMEESAAALVYSKLHEGIRWNTTIAYSKRRGDCWVGIRIRGEATVPKVRMPKALKPRVIEYLLNSLGGAYDGTLLVANTPYRLNDDEIELATSISFGEELGRLPIAYVSVGFDGSYSIDPAALANDLGGMCHVVVEPNRNFSRILQLQTQSENVYGGTICVIWPQNAERREFYLGDQFASVRQLKSAIIDYVCSTWSNRTLQRRITLEHVQSLVSRRALEQIRLALEAKGSQELDSYIEEFDKEIAARNALIADRDREIAALKSQLAAKPRTTLGHQQLMKTADTEQEFYEREFSGIIVGQLSKTLSNLLPSSRRHHVISAVVLANSTATEQLENSREKLKKILNGYSKMSAVVRSDLVEMGFAITEEGKHYKLVYRSDDRYVFTLPKSGSDWRGSMNATSDISRLLF